jgi:hypothetical protein
VLRASNARCRATAHVRRFLSVSTSLSRYWVSGRMSRSIQLILGSRAR